MAGGLSQLAAGWGEASRERLGAEPEPGEGKRAPGLRHAQTWGSTYSVQGSHQKKRNCVDVRCLGGRGAEAALAPCRRS